MFERQVAESGSLSVAVPHIQFVPRRLILEEELAARLEACFETLEPERIARRVMRQA